MERFRALFFCPDSCILNYMKKIILTIISIIVGYNFGQLIFIALLGAWNLLVPGGLFGDNWVFAIIFGLLALKVFGLVTAVFFALVSMGKFNSENWRVNRYLVVIIVPAIIYIIFYSAASSSDAKNLSARKQQCEESLTKEAKLDCIYHAYILGGKRSECDRYQDQDEKSKCLFGLATHSKKVEDCLFIGSQQDREFCISVAYNKSEKDCFSINTPWVRSNCYSSIAVKKKNPAICAPNIDQHLRDVCYRNYVANTSDKKACNLIVDKEIQSRCLQD